MVQQVEPVTFIRKYVTTKTTTTGVPPPQYIANDQILSQQAYQRQMASSCTQLQGNQYLMQPVSSSQTRFRCASTQNHGFQQSSQQQQQGFRSASIPPPQRFDINDGINVNNNLDNTLGSNCYSSRLYSNSVRTTGEHLQQPQPIVTSRESKSSSQQYNTSYSQGGQFQQRSSSAAAKNTQTLPVSYSQYQNGKHSSHMTNNEHMSSSNSCIDYSNLHYARQGNGIEKPIPNKPQTIPIHQQ